MSFSFGHWLHWLVLGAFSSAVTEYKVMQTWEKHEARATPELSTLPGVSFYWTLRPSCRTDLDGRLTSIGFVLLSSDIPLSVFPFLPLPLIPRFFCSSFQSLPLLLQPLLFPNFFTYCLFCFPVSSSFCDRDLIFSSIRQCYLYILTPRGISANCTLREIIMQVKMIR